MKEKTQRIFRVEKTKEYSVISNSPLRDNRISFKATGIMAFLLTMDDSWEVIVEALIKMKTDGRDSIRAGIKELKKFGYLVLKNIYENGKIIKREYNIFEKPSILPQKTSLKTDFPFEEISKKKLKTDFLNQENLKQENLIQENPTLINTNNKEILKEINTNNTHTNLSDFIYIKFCEKLKKNIGGAILPLPNEKSSLKTLSNDLKENEIDELLELFFFLKLNSKKRYWNNTKLDLSNFAQNINELMIENQKIKNPKPSQGGNVRDFKKPEPAANTIPEKKETEWEKTIREAQARIDAKRKLAEVNK